MAQKSVLGKGLASLLPGAAVMGSSAEVASAPVSYGSGAVAAGNPLIQQDIGNRDRHPGISFASVDEIIVNNYQPRRDFDQNAIQELAQSIRANGVIQPLIVRKTAQGYQLIAGERRLRASKVAGLKQVPIVIRKSTDREALEIALIENIQRQDLNCIDEALAYFQLIQDFALTQEEVALRVGKDRATVANHLRLLRLPEAIVDDLKRQIISFGHGKVLAGLEDNDQRLQLRKEIVERRLSVRDAEAFADQLKQAAIETPAGAPVAARQFTPVASRLSALAQSLTRHWSAKVEIKGTERRGRITVHYASGEELERILNAMQNEQLWAAQ